MPSLSSIKERLGIAQVDRTFWVLFGCLIAVAVLSLFSASSTLVYERGSVLGPIGQQMFFIVLGIAAAFGLQFAPTRIIRGCGYLLLGVSILFVWMLLIPGNPFVVTVNGAARWMRLFGITFQPSELAKLSLIIVVADMLSKPRSEEDKKRTFYRTLILTGIVVLPIMTANLSTAILISGIVFLLWILARIPAKYSWSTAGIAIIALLLGYLFVEFTFVRPGREMDGPFARAITWVKRIDRKFTAPEEDKNAPFRVTDENRQEAYAHVAIARGGLSPIGVLPGNSKERDYLPLAFADYIFAIIVEESGIVGATFLIFIYLAILFRASYISSRYHDPASMLMVMGLALMITCQALISMLVAVGLGPVTGQPLPLISKGGTSVLITSIYFGIMLSVSREQLTLRNRQQSATAASAEDAPVVTLE